MAEQRSTIWQRGWSRLASVASSTWTLVRGRKESASCAPGVHHAEQAGLAAPPREGLTCLDPADLPPSIVPSWSEGVRNGVAMAPARSWASWGAERLREALATQQDQQFEVDALRRELAEAKHQVLRALEFRRRQAVLADEVTHLRAELKTLRSVDNGHDPEALEARYQTCHEDLVRAHGELLALRQVQEAGHVERLELREALETSKSEAAAALRALRGETERLANRLEEARGRAAASDERLGSLIGLLDAERAARAAASARFEEVVATVKHLQTQVASLEQARDQAEREAQEAREARQQLTEQVRGLLESASAARKWLGKLTAELTTDREANAQHAARLHLAQTAVQQLQERVASLEESLGLVARHEQSLLDTRNEIARLSASLEEISRAVAAGTAAAESEGLRVRLETFQEVHDQALSALQESHAGLAASLEQVRADTLAQQGTVEAEVAQLQTELEALRANQDAAASAGQLGLERLAAELREVHDSISANSADAADDDPFTAVPPARASGVCAGEFREHCARHEEEFTALRHGMQRLEAALDEVRTEATARTWLGKLTASPAPEPVADPSPRLAALEATAAQTTRHDRELQALRTCVDQMAADLERRQVAASERLDRLTDELAADRTGGQEVRAWCEQERALASRLGDRLAVLEDALPRWEREQRQARLAERHTEAERFENRLTELATELRALREEVGIRAADDRDQKERLSGELRMLQQALNGNRADEVESTRLLLERVARVEEAVEEGRQRSDPTRLLAALSVQAERCAAEVRDLGTTARATADRLDRLAADFEADRAERTGPPAQFLLEQVQAAARTAEQVRSALSRLAEESVRQQASTRGEFDRIGDLLDGLERSASATSARLEGLLAEWGEEKGRQEAYRSDEAARSAALRERLEALGQAGNEVARQLRMTDLELARAREAGRSLKSDVAGLLSAVAEVRQEFQKGSRTPGDGSEAQVLERLAAQEQALAEVRRREKELREARAEADRLRSTLDQAEHERFDQQVRRLTGILEGVQERLDRLAGADAR